MQDRKLRISVIMGVYNCASTLQEALDSLFAQTYQNFEIVMCDDGSIDNTYEVALQNAQIHDNIVLLKNEKNLGLNATLNKCIEVAKGEYLARMDGDDISLPERFEKEIAFLDSHPEYAIVSSPMIYFDEEGDFRTGKGIGEVKKEDFLHGSPICHAASMTRTATIKKVGGYAVDPKLLRVEDYNLWMRMYAAGFKAYMMAEPLYKMRDDRNAKSRRTWKSRKNEMYVMSTGFKMLGLPWYTQLYALRPLLAYLAPSWLYEWYHKNR